MPVKRKRGRLSVAEIDFITKHASTKSDEWIAKQLNRTEENIKTWREEKLGIAAEDSDDDSIKYKVQLRQKPFFADLKLQFTESELRSFEYQWGRLAGQFRGDITHTEEQQMIDVITLGILMDRVLKDKASTLKQKERIERELDKELRKDESLRDVALIGQLQLQLSNIIQSQQSVSREYVTLQEKKQKLFGDLKGTREQRVKHLTDNKKTFFDLIKMLHSEEAKDRQGKEIAIMKGAMDKEMERLGSDHQFMDQMVDKPFLTPETILEDEENEDE